MTVQPRPERRWTCAQCGGPGQPDPATALDARYTTGICLTNHKGPQYLVREGVFFTEKKKPTELKVQQELHLDPPTPDPTPPQDEPEDLWHPKA